MRFSRLAFILGFLFALSACANQSNEFSPGAPPAMDGKGAVLKGIDLCPDPAGPKPASLFYTGLLSVRYGHLLPVSAFLTDDTGAALVGKTVTFHLDAQTTSGITDANGVARSSFVVTAEPGTLPLALNFAGEEGALASEASASVIVIRDSTILRPDGSIAYIASGGPRQLKAVLLNSDKLPIPGKTVTFQMGGVSASGTTDLNGKATVTMNVLAGNGSSALKLDFAGDVYYEPSHFETGTFVYQQTAFAIWGGNPGGLSIGQRVNFWGAQWAKQVTGGDYASNNSFKGFAYSLASFSVCQPGAHSSTLPVLTQTCWTTKPGNSFPPNTLPDYIGVLVPTVIVKSGEDIYGNIAALAILNVNKSPAYGPAPGKPGYGTIVAFIDGTGSAPAATLSAVQTQPSTVLPSQAFNVTANVTNPGQTQALNVTVSEGFENTSPATAQSSLGTIAGGASKTATFPRTAPSIGMRLSDETVAQYQGRLGSFDGRLLASRGTVTFTDPANQPVVPVDLVSFSQLILPRFTLSLSAPRCVEPGSTVTYTITAANVGSAAAQGATAVLTFPDGTTTTFAMGQTASGGSVVRTADWTAPSNGTPDQVLTATVTLTWNDASNNQYGAIDASTSTRLVISNPILAITAGQPVPMLPLQSVPVSFTVTNSGSGEASEVTLRVTRIDGSTDTAPQFSLAGSASITVSRDISAPEVQPKGSQESDSEYLARLGAANGSALNYPFNLMWKNSSGTSFGPVNGELNTTLILPVLSVEVAGPETANPGYSVQYTVSVSNTGSATARGVHALVTFSDGNSTEVAFNDLAPGASETRTVDWYVPEITPPQPGEDNSLYTARLQAADGRVLLTTAGLGWADDLGNPYGILSAQTEAVQRLSIITAAAGAVPVLLPGQIAPVPFDFANIGSADAANILLGVTRYDGIVDPSPLFSLAVGASGSMPGTVTGPAMAPKDASETDGAYAARLGAYGGAALQFPYSVDWTDTAGTAVYGPLHGILSTTGIVPICGISISAPSTVSPGATVAYTVTVSNSGNASAAAASATVTFPDLTTGSLSFGAVSAGASVSGTLSWTAPSFEPRQPGESFSAFIERFNAQNGRSLAASASDLWSDAIGNSYGPLSASVSTTYVIPTDCTSGSTESRSCWGTGSQARTCVAGFWDDWGTCACPADYIMEGDLCINSKQVACAENTSKPANSHDVSAQVTITYTTAGGWTSPSICNWACDAGYHLDQGGCEADVQTMNVNAVLTGPANALPGAPMEYVLTVNNIGTAAAMNVQATVAFPDGTTGNQVFGNVPAGTSASMTVTWMAPSAVWRQGEDAIAYLFRLYQMSGTVLIATASVNWTDGAGNPYSTLTGRVSTVIRIPVVAPVISDAQLLPGQRLSKPITFYSAGSADAANINFSLTDIDGTTSAVPQFDLARGAMRTGDSVNISAAPVAPKGELEPDAVYRSRLMSLSNTSLGYPILMSWMDAAAGMAYGPVSGPWQAAKLTLPVVDVTLGNIPNEVYPGQDVGIGLRALNTGSAAAKTLTATVIFTDGGGNSTTINNLSVSGSSPKGPYYTNFSIPYTIPEVPPKAPGETNEAYLARLSAIGNQTQNFRVEWNWTDYVDNHYGPMSIEGATGFNIQVPVLTVAADPIPVLHPGQQVSERFFVTNIGDVYTEDVAASITNPDGTITESIHSSLFGGDSTSLYANAFAPVLVPKGVLETDGDYKARLLALSGQALNFPYSLVWKGPYNAIYGPLTGTLSTTEALPVMVPDLSAPDSAFPGETVMATVVVKNAGSSTAALLSGTTTIHDGTQTHWTVSGIGPGASVQRSATFAMPVIAPKTGGETTQSYLARLRSEDGKTFNTGTQINWTDSKSNSYGPLGALKATAMKLPILDVALAGPAAVRAGDSAVYTLTIANNSRATAKNIAVEATMPDGTVTPVQIFTDALSAGTGIDARFRHIAKHEDAGAQAAVEVRVSWADDKSNVYGPVSANAATDVLPGNTAPVAEAGSDQTTTLPAPVTLNGIVTDDDLPEGAQLAADWSKVSGPGMVNFSNPVSAQTTAAFSEAGTYVLKLTASDGQFSSSDTVTVTVKPAAPAQGYEAEIKPGDALPGENLINIVKDGNQVGLADKAKAFNFIWVAATSDIQDPPYGRVVKIDTTTGNILGSYLSSPDGQPRDPSRTTVDHNGGVWVANRAGNSVVHIGLAENGGCADRNGNGVIDTSTGLNDVKPWTNHDDADVNGGVSTAEDECITHYVRTTSYGTRHVSVNADNDVWVSGTGGRQFDLIDGRTGAIKRKEPSVGFGGYGGLVDGNGVIWSANPLLRWDPSFPLFPSGKDKLWKGYDHDSYGLCIDSKGYVWNTAQNGERWPLLALVRKFAPDGTLVGAYDYLGEGVWEMTAQGCAVDKGDNVWIAHSRNFSRSVTRLRNDGVKIGSVTLPSEFDRYGNEILPSPTGVAVDGAGKVWTTNYLTCTVTRIDPNAGPTGNDGVTPKGAVDLNISLKRAEDDDCRLYNYSDMTGSTLQGAPERGAWEFVLDSGIENARWGRAYWMAQVSGDGTIAVRAASSGNGTDFGETTVVNNGHQFSLPDGRYIRIEMRFTRSTKGESPRLYSFNVATLDYQNFNVPDNKAPVVAAGHDKNVHFADPVRLTGSVRDDALPGGTPLTISWTKVSGPGSVVFARADQEATDVTFSDPGEYVLRLTANDSEFETSDDIRVKLALFMENWPPVVSAGPPQELLYPTLSTTLHGTALDDGLPEGGHLTVKWSKATGPGEVYFTDPNNLDTGVTFSLPGRYVLRLTANDSQLSSSAEVVIAIDEAVAEGNLPPVVNAGPNTTMIWPQRGLTLQGSATDDGLPLGSTITYWWTMVSGPRQAVFEDNADPATIVVFYDPGSYVLRLTASDGESSSSSDVMINLRTVSAGNKAPVVSAGPNKEITWPQNSVFLTGSATDDSMPVGSKLSVWWEDAGGPGTVTFTSLSAADPAITQVTFSTPGQYLIRLVADDSELVSSSVAVVNVYPEPGNQAPQVSVTAPAVVSFGSAATLAATVTDDGLPTWGSLVVGWSQISGPGYVTFTQPDQQITGATFSATGTYQVKFEAWDGELSTAVYAMMEVSSENQPPVMEIANIQMDLAYPEMVALLEGSVHDDGLPVGGNLTTWWSVVAGDGEVSFADPGAPNTTATFSYPGSYLLRLNASDSEMYSSAEMVVNVGAPVGAIPTVEITAPTDGAEITTRTEVVGSVSSGVWKVEYSRDADEDLDARTWTEVASGEGAVTNGTLCKLDPTMMQNGTYILKLSSITEQGEAYVTSTFTVNKNLKVGNFSVSFADLTIPVAGLPITITRTYDSRNKAVGDFGAGWNLSISNIRVEKSGNLGRNWYETRSGNLPFWNYCLESNKPSYVTITFPDGKVYKFNVRPVKTGTTESCSLMAPFEWIDVSMEFAPAEGTNGTLEIDISHNVFVTSEEGDIYPKVVTLNDQNNGPFNPKDFKLTTEDGTVYDLRQGEGVKKITDRNGNTLTVTRDGILHSSGKSVTFTRDTLGRIITITDPSGNQINYSYDAAGNLITHEDRESNDTTFAYDSIHNLLNIKDPMGRTPIINEYDDSGRLIAHTDAYGNRIEYTHAIDQNMEVVKDRLGRTRYLSYDDEGNVTTEIAADGTVTTRTYDTNGDILTQTKDNKTTTYTYDRFHNKLSESDPMGHVTSYTYNEYQQVATITDAKNRTTTNTYVAGRLMQTTDTMGNSNFYTYDTAGNMLSRQDALGKTTNYQYDGSGNMTKVIDAYSHETSYTYDENGNRLTETTTRTTSSGLETLTTTYVYDENGRAISVTTPDGATARMEYDGTGRTSKSVDKLGRETTYTYDSMGRMTRTTYPDGTYDEKTYDAEGQMLTSRDRGGLVTSYEYDQVGRVKKTVNPDGTFTASTFDAYGFEKTRTDERGSTTTISRDDAWRLVKETDALGHETSYTYDEVGNELSVTDAKGNTTTFEYDNHNRKTKTIYPNLTFTQTGYNANGKRISETDQAGKTTQFTYDDIGRLVKVTDALNQETQYVYDEVGNRTAQIDANGHTTSFAFDSQRREVMRTLPDGKYETKVYNNADNVISRTNFKGETATYTYDINDREIERLYPDGTKVDFTYTMAGRRATAKDSRGTTTYTYNDAGRLAGITYPDGRTLEYAYENGLKTGLTAVISGTRYSTTYSFDALKRLDNVTDPNGRQYGYTYDPNGNRESLTYPNGVATAYTYDSQNRLTNLSTTKDSTVIQSYAYTLGPTGIRTHIDEADGTKREYTYDDLYRLTGEKISDIGGTVQYENTFTYDPVGNRLTQVKATQSNSTTLTSTYDNRDRLQTDTDSTYSWDDEGNMAGKTGTDGAAYTWNFDHRLTKVVKTDGSVVEHLYDADGNRVRTITTINGISVITDFLVDTSRNLSHVVAETDYDGILKSLYVRGDDELVSVIRPNGNQLRFYHADGLGSIRRLTDVNGTVTDFYTYSAFGELLNHTGTDQNPYQFAGEPRDATSGLNYHRARWYNARSGTFISSDPFGGRMDDPKSLHRYLYADNDPINMIDFTGKWSSIAPFLVHQRAIDDAGILIAYSENELRILNDMQLEVDGKPYQTPNFAYYHAMRNGDSGQTAGQAQQESNDRVRNLIISARDLKKSNDHDGYLKELGRAMHTIQDSTAPTHHGFQPWYDYFGGKANPDEWEHALPEQIYPRIGSWLVEATDDTVRHFYNTKDPLPRDFFNKYGCDGISTQIKQQIMRFTVPSDNAILFESFFGGLFY